MPFLIAAGGIFCQRILYPFLHLCHLLHLLPKYNFLIFLYIPDIFASLISYPPHDSVNLIFLSSLSSRWSLEGRPEQCIPWPCKNPLHNTDALLYPCARSKSSTIPLGHSSSAEASKKKVTGTNYSLVTWLFLGLQQLLIFLFLYYPFPILLFFSSTGLSGWPGMTKILIPHENVHLLVIMHLSGWGCCTHPSTIPIKYQETSKWIT